jgi:hypothetical protein
MPFSKTERVGFILLACCFLGLLVVLAGTRFGPGRPERSRTGWTVRGGVPKNWKGPSPKWDTITIVASAKPASVPMDGESVLTVVVTDISPDYDSRGVHISFAPSRAFSVSPAEVVVPPSVGSSSNFLVTPAVAGGHSLLINAQCMIDPDLSAKFPQPIGQAALHFDITPVRSFLGLTSSGLDVVQKISSVIGLPGLILVLIGRKGGRRPVRHKA